MIHNFLLKLAVKGFPMFFSQCILGKAALMFIPSYLVCKVGLSKQICSFGLGVSSFVPIEYLAYYQTVLQRV